MPAVVFLVHVAESGDRNPTDVVRFGSFQSFDTADRRAGWEVDQLVLELRAVAAIFESVVEPDGVKTRAHHDGGARVIRPRCDDPDEIVFTFRYAPRVRAGVPEEDFLLAELIAGSGTIDLNARVGAEKRLVGGKQDVESDADILVAAAFTSFEPDATIVEDLRLIPGRSCRAFCRCS